MQYVLISTWTRILTFRTKVTYFRHNTTVKGIAGNQFKVFSLIGIPQVANCVQAMCLSIGASYIYMTIIVVKTCCPDICTTFRVISLNIIFLLTITDKFVGNLCLSFKSKTDIGIISIYRFIITEIMTCNLFAIHIKFIIIFIINLCSVRNMC